MAEKHDSWQYKPDFSCLIIAWTLAASSCGGLIVSDQNVQSQHSLCVGIYAQ